MTAPTMQERQELARLLDRITTGPEFARSAEQTYLLRKLMNLLASPRFMPLVWDEPPSSEVVLPNEYPLDWPAEPTLVLNKSGTLVFYQAHDCPIKHLLENIKLIAPLPDQLPE